MDKWYFKKSLGQNFLKNEKICEQILKKVSYFQENFDVEQVVEIGPGHGALTYSLKDLPKPLTLVELDDRLVDLWTSKGFKVIKADALKLDWDEFPENTLLVSNLPYQIAARLIVELSQKKSVNTMVIMLQKEVGLRVLSDETGSNYGFLSVVANLGWEVYKITEASPEDFTPAPKVSGLVLALRRKKILDKKFIQFVKMAFSNRRKKLIKSLNWDKDKWTAVCQELSLSEDCRADSLSYEIFEQLFSRSLS